MSIAVLGVLALLTALVWASVSAEELYLNDHLVSRTYHSGPLAIAVLMLIAGAAAGGALICYLARRPVMAKRIVLVSAAAGLPAVLPAAMGIGIWWRIRNEE